jgi:hypothetical protein
MYKTTQGPKLGTAVLIDVISHMKEHFPSFTDAVMAKFGVDQNHVKEAIRIKLNNEDKLRKRLTQKLPTGAGGL